VPHAVTSVPTTGSANATDTAPRPVIGRTIDVLRRTPSDEAMVAAAHDPIDVGDDILVGWYNDWVIIERERFRQCDCLPWTGSASG
jgi:hypothetical protein